MRCVPFAQYGTTQIRVNTDIGTGKNLKLQARPFPLPSLCSKSASCSAWHAATCAAAEPACLWPALPCLSRICAAWLHPASCTAPSLLLLCLVCSCLHCADSMSIIQNTGCDPAAADHGRDHVQQQRHLQLRLCVPCPVLAARFGACFLPTGQTPLPPPTPLGCCFHPDLAHPLPLVLRLLLLLACHQRLLVRSCAIRAAVAFLAYSPCLAFAALSVPSAGDHVDQQPGAGRHRRRPRHPHVRLVLCSLIGSCACLHSLLCAAETPCFGALACAVCICMRPALTFPSVLLDHLFAPPSFVSPCMLPTLIRFPFSSFTAARASVRIRTWSAPSTSTTT